MRPPWKQEADPRNSPDLLSGCGSRMLDTSIAGMPRFYASDGTELAYHLQGDGAPLVCLPGGLGRASAYLGDLGGVSARRQWITLNVRGTGESAAPADPASYRCDRLVEDVA